MPPHGHYGNTSNVRWDEDEQEWMLRCPDCVGKRNTKYFWPLTLEFWKPRMMQRCRACDAERRAANERKRMLDNPPLREARNQSAKEYFQANKEALRYKNRIRQRAWRAAKKQGGTDA